MLGFTLPAPGPAGPLTITVACRTGTTRVQHDVILHEDWTLETPHDLEAERVSVALGGVCSCVELVDVVVPASQVWLRRNLRHHLLPMLSLDDDVWCATSPVECCRAGPAVAVADHLRSAVHLAVVHGITEKVNLSRIAARLRAIHLPLPTEDVSPLLGLAVTSLHDLLELWKVGLHPEWVANVHAQVGATAPLDPDFYRTVLTRSPDLSWLRRTARADVGLLGWLARTEEEVDRARPERRRAWLDLDLDLATVEVLNRSRYGPQDVQLLAGRRGRTVTEAAALLFSLATSGAQPPLPRVLASVGAGGPVWKRGPHAAGAAVAPARAAGHRRGRRVRAAALRVGVGRARGRHLRRVRRGAGRGRGPRRLAARAVRRTASSPRVDGVSVTGRADCRTSTM